jgi:hypothetical protein
MFSLYPSPTTAGNNMPGKVAQAAAQLVCQLYISPASLPNTTQFIANAS